MSSGNDEITVFLSEWEAAELNGDAAALDGGERLHEWMAGKGPDGGVDLGVVGSGARVGAAIIGRRTFDLGVGLWGGTPFPGVPSFVVTHRARQDLLGGNGGTFAFEGLEAAARRAKDAAPACCRRCISSPSPWRGSSRQDGSPA
jgi:dihydrofolate reductase